MFLSITQLEKNQCVDFFAKSGVSSDAGFLTHISSSEGVRDLLGSVWFEIFGGKGR
jgi:hypothetical protein